MDQMASRGLKVCIAIGGLAVLAIYGADIRAKGGEIASQSTASNSSAAPVFSIRIPAKYRDWPLISVAHEEGSLNDIRAIIGNEVALRAYRDGKRPFPDGTVIVRLAWNYTSSEENNKVFGRAQSFVAGTPTDWYLQVMVKDSKKYASTQGWGYAQFDKDGRPADAAKHQTCAPCHQAANTHDFVFTNYAP